MPVKLDEKLFYNKLMLLLDEEDGMLGTNGKRQKLFIQKSWTVHIRFIKITKTQSWFTHDCLSLDFPILIIHLMTGSRSVNWLHWKALWLMWCESSIYGDLSVMAHSQMQIMFWCFHHQVMNVCEPALWRAQLSGFPESKSGINDARS